MSEVTADTIAVRILFEAERAQRDAHSYGVSVERAMAAVEVATTKAAGAATVAAAKQSEAYRALGRSISGAVADAIEGKNAFAILGQHGTEVASAFTHFGGTVGRVATFLSGPWGAATGRAVSVGGQLASTLLNDEDTTRRAAQCKLDELQTGARALQGDRAAIKSLLAREGRGPSASVAAAPRVDGPSVVIAAAPVSPRDTAPPLVDSGLDAASALQAANDALAAVAAKGEALFDAAAKADAASFGETAKVREAVRNDAFGQRVAEVTKAIETARGASEALARDLSTGLAQAILKGESLGKVLENAFLKAGAAAIQSRIFDLLTTGEIGGLFKSIGSFVGGPAAAKAPGRASGGHVSAGQLYRVNELGIEGFRPAGSGTIVPLGRMAAQPRAGGVTVVQPLNVSFAGAITTPELMAQFKAYADSVGQAAAIGGAAMAQSRIARRAARALPR